MSDDILAAMREVLDYCAKGLPFEGKRRNPNHPIALKAQALLSTPSKKKKESTGVLQAYWDGTLTCLKCGKLAHWGECEAEAGEWVSVKREDLDALWILGGGAVRDYIDRLKAALLQRSHNER